MTYKDVYQSWQSNPEGFWLDAAQTIDWITPPNVALSATKDGEQEWFADAMVNTCWNAVDRHVQAGRGDQNAIIYDSPVTDTISHITFAELQDRVALLAGALQAKGVGKGDRVIIYMPMVPEALYAMLACGRIGAIHSVVFGGFAAKELATRIDDATPKAILAASCGIEPSRIVQYKPLLDEAISTARHTPEFCLILQRDECPATCVAGRDYDWYAAQDGVTPADCVPVEGNHPSYILYTSGTTGQPKGVVRPTAGQLVALSWSMRNIYDVQPGDVFWAASDVGWVVGHSYICYGPLINGNTTVLFEGKPVGTPDAGTFWRIISQHKVRSFFTAPTAFRAVKREDPKGELLQNYDLSALKYVFLAGERADPDTVQWAEEKTGKPVIDHWWQTETSWSIAANPAGIELLPTKLGSPTVPMPGYQIEVLDEAGNPVTPGTLGAIAVRLPLPPSCFTTVWNAHDRYIKSYMTQFPGYYETGDAGMIDDDGYVYIMARTDDVINVAGHRLSTGAMEEVIASHPDVAECAVIGAADVLKGQVPVAFACLNAGVTRNHSDICRELVALVREKIGPVAAFRHAAVVDRLPKTRSGKILRATMAKIADGETPIVPATIEEPIVLEEIGQALRTLGFARPATSVETA
jgi:propionyl-CoA synthetase